MQITTNDFLREILTIIDHPNKEKFITEFTRLNHLEAIANIIESKSQSLRNSIQDLPELEREQAMMNCIEEKEYYHEISNVSHKALTQFLKTILPELNTEVKEKIANLLAAN